MIGRRDLLLLLGASALPGMSRAQAKPPVLIGWLNTASRDSSIHLLAAFKDGLAAFGWKEGSQFTIEERWADGAYARVQPLAEGLAARKPAVIVAGPLQAVRAAARAAPGIPVVSASGGDLVAAKLAASLARPGGTVTGLTNVSTSVAEKYLDMVIDTSPKLRRVGVLSDPGNLNSPLLLDSVRRSVATRSIEARFAEATRPEQIEAAISRLAKEGVQALVIIVSALYTSERSRIVKLALAHRWPVVAGASEFAEAGALVTYGVDTSAQYRRAAYYVDRILKGAKPGDLPIEQPTKFELVVNLKTAKTLGLTIPQPFLMRVDRVIE